MNLTSLMALKAWLRPPRHLLAPFLALTLVPAGGLVWLGLRLLEQDHALESQRLQDSRERAADLIVTALEQDLSAAEHQLAASSASPAMAGADGAVRVVFGLREVAAYPRNRLLYYPYLPASPGPSGEPFAAGEEQEIRSRDSVKAAALFRELARSPDPAVRAGALVRLARNLRKAGQLEAALAAYVELARLRDVRVDGVPADLVGRRAQCALLGELKREGPLRSQAEALYTDLRGGRWLLTRAVYQLHMEEVRGWAGADPKLEAELESLAAGVEWLWQKWNARSRDEGPPNGREFVETADGPVTILWQGAGDRLAALVVSSGYVERQWLARLQRWMESQGVRAWFSEMNGRHGGEAASRAVARRARQDTGLPWTLLVATTRPPAELEEFAGRRRLLFIGLALIGVLVLAGVYFTGRAVARELAVARLQSEFVAAVSHEFRTPLTSLRQFTEILAERRMPEDRRDGYYQALLRATNRLHRLVEGLLDFGRMEAGASVYRFELLDAAALTGAVVEEFQRETESRGYRVEFTTNGGEAQVSADRESLTRAIWNLLDNAEKYSPGCRTVWVETVREDRQVAIRVRDRGLGIPPQEQQEIFRKFVRGSSSKGVKVKGTGIGLTMVHHIVQAHGGSLRLESRPGEGSTFTILLPAGG